MLTLDKILGSSGRRRVGAVDIRQWARTTLETSGEDVPRPKSKPKCAVRGDREDLLDKMKGEIWVRGMTESRKRNTLQTSEEQEEIPLETSVVSLDYQRDVRHNNS